MARYRRVPRAKVTVVAPATAAPATYTLTDPSALNKAELVEYARQRDVDTSGTKADILARLEDGQ